MIDEAAAKDPVAASQLPPGGGFLLAEVGAAPIDTPDAFTSDQREFFRTARKFGMERVVPAADAIEAKDFPTVRRLFREAGELGLLSLDIPEEHGGLAQDDDHQRARGRGHDGPGRLVGHLRRAGRHRHASPSSTSGPPSSRRGTCPSWRPASGCAAYALSEPSSASDALAAQDPGGALARREALDPERHQAVDLQRRLRRRLHRLRQGGRRASSAPSSWTSDTPGFTTGPRSTRWASAAARRGRSSSRTRRSRPRTCSARLARGTASPSTSSTSAGSSWASPAWPASGTSSSSRVHLRQGAEGLRQAHLRLRPHPGEAGPHGGAGLRGRGHELPHHRSHRPARRGRRAPPAARRSSSATCIAAVEEYSVEASILKVWGSEALSQVADEGVQIHGGYGFVEEYPIERDLPGQPGEPDLRGHERDQPAAHPGHAAQAGGQGRLPVPRAGEERRPGRRSAARSRRPGRGRLAREKRVAELGQAALRLRAGVALEGLRAGGGRPAGGAGARWPTWPWRRSPSTAPWRAPCRPGRTRWPRRACGSTPRRPTSARRQRARAAVLASREGPGAGARRASSGCGSSSTTSRATWSPGARPSSDPRSRRGATRSPGADLPGVV